MTIKTRKDGNLLGSSPQERDAMTERIRPIRTAGTVPADYHGAVYWRLVQYHSLTGKSDEPIEFLDSRERQDRLWIDRYKMPGKDIFSSGTVFDESGQILPEW